MSIYHKHHIIPKHMNGSDDPSNLVVVTIEQHAELHKQLWEDLGHWQDELAWKMLSKQITNKEANYLAAKNAHKGCTHSDNAKKKMRDAWIARKIDSSYLSHMFGRKHSEETRHKMRQSRLGKPSPNRGNRFRHSEEAILKMAAVMTCPVCNKTMRINSYNRYKHGIHCEQNKEIIKWS